MKKLFLSFVGFLAITATTSSAALVYTFMPTDSGVLMKASGSVDVSSATFFDDSPISSSATFSVSLSAIETNNVLPAGTVIEILNGVDLLPTDLTNNLYNGAYVAGSGDIWVTGQFILLFSTSDPAIIDDNARNATVYSSTMEVLFAGQTLASMGLNAYPTHTLIDLWGASAGATDDEKVQFIVVPEPSSTALLGLGGLALILRRRRSA